MPEENDADTLVKGFRLLRVPVSAGSPVSRGLLVKKHVARDEDENQTGEGRTLFVTHLDNFVTEAQLKTCFGAGFGAVEEVEVKTVEKKFARHELKADDVVWHVNWARVVFYTDESLEKALAAADGRICGATMMPLPGAELKEQMKVQRGQYRDALELREEIDKWMAGFDAREEEKRQKLRESAKVDEDGFTKVVGGVTKSSDKTFSIRSAARPQIRSGAFHEPIKGYRDPVTQGDKRKRKKKEQEKTDFYRFQDREKRRQEIMGYRKKAREDSAKVDQMKKANRFKVLKDKVARSKRRANVDEEDALPKEKTKRMKRAAVETEEAVAADAAA